MRFAFLTVSLVALMAISCSGNSSPVAPDNSVADLPVWTIHFQGEDYLVGPGDLLEDRTTAGVVDPGTDMTADELRLYFGVRITHQTFPGMWECVIFKYYMMPLMNGLPDSELFAWVESFEENGVDIPNGPPPPPIC